MFKPSSVLQTEGGRGTHYGMPQTLTFSIGTAEKEEETAAAVRSGDICSFTGDSESQRPVPLRPMAEVRPLLERSHKST